MNIHYNMTSKVFEHVLTLNSALGQLEWDLFTRMPITLNSSSADKVMTLQSVLHGMLCSNFLGGFIEKSINESSNLDVIQIANLSAAREMHQLARAVPLNLIEEITRNRMACYDAWSRAVNANDPGIAMPFLDVLIKHMREYLAIKSSVIKVNNIYDAVLRSVDSELTVSSIDGLFVQMGRFLSDHGEQLSAPKKISRHRQIFPIGKQEDLARCILSRIFKDKINLGVMLHSPAERLFCDRDTIMISTNFSEHDLGCCVRQVLAHSGRSMFCLGADGHTFPSSGGLLSETVASMLAFYVGSSVEFAEFMSGDIAELFASKNKPWNSGSCRDAMNRANCSMNRLECGEVFSVAHSMMRYTIERELISGNINAESIPDIWNEGSKRYFRATPKHVHEGCLQDVHWYQGIFGYFPVQAVGVMMGSQLFNGVSTNMSGLSEGNFGFIEDFLLKNVVGHAGRMTVQEILLNATGSNFKLGSYFDYLQKKYELV